MYIYIHIDNSIDGWIYSWIHQFVKKKKIDKILGIFKYKYM